MSAPTPAPASQVQKVTTNNLKGISMTIARVKDDSFIITVGNDTYTATNTEALISKIFSEDGIFKPTLKKYFEMADGIPGNEAA